MNITVNPRTYGLRTDPPVPCPAGVAETAQLPVCPRCRAHTIRVHWDDASLPGEPLALVPGSWWCPAGCPAVPPGRKPAVWRPRARFGC